MSALLDVVSVMLPLVNITVVESLVDLVGVKSIRLTEVPLMISTSRRIVCLGLNRMINKIEKQDEIIKIQFINVRKYIPCVWRWYYCAP